jgi:hypothetical protein
MPEPTTPLEARHALKTLTDAIASLEIQLADMTVREREQAAQSRGLQMRENEARQKLGSAERCCRDQLEKVKELEPQVRDLTRRLAEETARADTADEQSAAVSAKAGAYEQLVGLSLRLLDAFDRLPMKHDDGHPIPSDVQHDIELYGTYEWKALADAKLALEGMVNQQTP